MDNWDYIVNTTGNSPIIFIHFTIGAFYAGIMQNANLDYGSCLIFNYLSPLVQVIKYQNNWRKFTYNYQQELLEG